MTKTARARYTLKFKEEAVCPVAGGDPGLFSSSRAGCLVRAKRVLMGRNAA
jgi:hypothetical protein